MLLLGLEKPTGGVRRTAIPEMWTRMAGCPAVCLRTSRASGLDAPAALCAGAGRSLDVQRCPCAPRSAAVGLGMATVHVAMNTGAVRVAKKNAFNFVKRQTVMDELCCAWLSRRTRATASLTSSAPPPTAGSSSSAPRPACRVAASRLGTMGPHRPPAGQPHAAHASSCLRPAPLCGRQRSRTAATCSSRLTRRWPCLPPSTTRSTPSALLSCQPELCEQQRCGRRGRCSCHVGAQHAKVVLTNDSWTPEQHGLHRSVLNLAMNIACFALQM
jgi:hypothetical protein